MWRTALICSYIHSNQISDLNIFNIHSMKITSILGLNTYNINGSCSAKIFNIKIKIDSKLWIEHKQTCQQCWSWNFMWIFPTSESDYCFPAENILEVCEVYVCYWK